MATRPTDDSGLVAHKSDTDKVFDPQRYLRRLGKGDYLEVKWRLVWLRTEHPDASIETELVQLREQPPMAIFRAKVSIPNAGSATGWGQEEPKDFGDYLEKAETKALGRALAALGYGTQFTDDFERVEIGGEAVGNVVNITTKQAENVAKIVAAQAKATDSQLQPPDSKISQPPYQHTTAPVSGTPSQSSTQQTRPTAQAASRAPAKASSAAPDSMLKSDGVAQSNARQRAVTPVRTGKQYLGREVLDFAGVQCVMIAKTGTMPEYYRTIDTCGDHKDAQSKPKHWTAMIDPNTKVLTPWRHKGDDDAWCELNT